VGALLAGPLAAAALALPAAASAAVFQVTNATDPGSGTCSPGNCSLRDAISVADGSAGNTVLVPPGTYTLSAGALALTNGMQIVGTSGAALTTISGNGATQIIKISGTTGAVSITGITFTKARGTEVAEGSAITDLGTLLTLSEDVFVRNTASSFGGAAFGAVAARGAGSSLTVVRSRFIANAAGGEGGGGPQDGFGVGGGIAFQGSGALQVNESVFLENTAGGNGGAGPMSGEGLGGAILAGGSGPAAVSNSAFGADRAGGNGGFGESSGRGQGGAIEFAGGAPTATLAVTGSVFSGNQAGGGSGPGSSSGEGSGGAITALREGTASLTNDTIAANSVGGPIGAVAGGGTLGGGLSTSIAVSVLNSTIDGNAVIGAGIGGNIEVLAGSLSLENTIVAFGSAASAPNCGGTVTSTGHNLESSTPSQCGLSSALGDVIGANPLLAPLQFNGGPTQTQDLLAGSPAIDAGNNNGCAATDQRGIARSLGAACDIGAYEVVPPTVITGPAGAVGATTASVTGTVTANTADASVRFQLGTSTAYGMQSSIQHVGGLTPAPVSASFAGLSPNTTYHYRALASSTDGASFGRDQTFTTGPTTPVITNPTQSHGAWRAGGKLAHLSRSKKKAPVGTTFSFLINEQATVTFTFNHRVSGRRVGGKCVAHTRRNTKHTSCKRTATAGALSFAAHSGKNKVVFQGRLSHAKMLKPGRYTVVMTATSVNGLHSSPVSLSFTIVR
jgi:hypothetical protein